jgi:3-deoxy-D-manno-octulosonic acid kinase
MMQERVHKDAVGEILFDAALSPQVDRDWFEPEHWHAQNALRTQAGGRGGVAIIDTPVGECVLRHYRRGGLVAAVMGDRYVWTGAHATRPFREFRLLGELARLGLPAPVAVAATYRLHGPFYRADLLTQRLPQARTLADELAGGKLNSGLAEEVGVLVARFHRANVWHADLNAHNVMIAPDGLYLIDFDRGCIREPAESWQQSNLQRLRRSLLKLGAGGQDHAAFDTTIWQPLMHCYRQTLTS